MTFFEFYVGNRKIATNVKNAGEYDLVDVGGRIFKVEFRQIGLNIYRVSVDDDTIVVRFLDEGIEDFRLEVEGHVIELRRRQKENAEVRGITGLVLASPLPGKVLAIKVNVGQKIAIGDELIIIESMKMQTAIRAERDSSIKSIMVKEGDIIRRGQPLLEFMV